MKNTKTISIKEKNEGGKHGYAKRFAKQVIGAVMALSIFIACGTTPVFAAGKSSPGSKQAMEAAQLVLQNITTDSMSDMEKITAVHDYMVIHTAYDMTAYQTGTSIIGKKTYHADGPILYGMGVCQGYSEAFKLYMDMLGIPCEVVSNANHAWNRVTLNGIYYDIDVTWDDPVPDTGAVDPSQIKHMYLFLTPEKMAFLHTDEGKYSYYADQYGAENVSTSINPITGKTVFTIHHHN